MELFFGEILIQSIYASLKFCKEKLCIVWAKPITMHTPLHFSSVEASWNCEICMTISWVLRHTTLSLVNCHSLSWEYSRGILDIHTLNTRQVNNIHLPKVSNEKVRSFVYKCPEKWSSLNKCLMSALNERVFRIKAKKYLINNY